MDDTKVRKPEEQQVIDPEKAAVAGIGFEEQGADEAPPEIVVEN